MESGSQVDNPPERTQLRMADVIGTLIALLTLTIPVMTIAYYSSSPGTNPGILQPATYSIPNSDD